MDGVAAEIAEEILMLFQHETSTPARASRKPSIMPAGPPPTMQQRVSVDSCAGSEEVTSISKCSLLGNLGLDELGEKDERFLPA